VRRAILFSFFLCTSLEGASGGLSGVAASDRLAPGTVRVIRWAAGPLAKGGTEQELVLSLDGGATFAVRVSRELDASTNAVRLRVPNLPTSRARLGLRVGKSGEGEVLLAESETFSILADPSAPAEAFGSVRGEAATLEANPDGHSVPPRPAGLSDVPERCEDAGNETALDVGDDDGGPTGLPADTTALPPASRRASAPAPEAESTPCPRSHPFRPRRQ
jgi:hypothetical protein